MSHQSETLTGKLETTWGKTTVGLGGVFAALVAIAAWFGIVATVFQGAILRRIGASMPATLLLAVGVATVFGIVLGGMVYARYRNLHLGWSLPSREHWASTLFALLAPLVLVGLASLLGNALFETGVSAMTQQQVSPNTSLSFLILISLLPGFVTGGGYGLLLGAVVFERVRQLVDESDAAAVAVALAGGFWLLPIEGGRSMQLTPGSAIETALSLIFGVAIAMAIGILYRRGDGGWSLPDLDTVDVTDAIVVLIAIVGVLGVGTDLIEVPRSIGDLLWVIGIGIAIVGYDRTRSVWVPVLSLAIFGAAVNGIVYVESVVGLAPAP
jgi:hypothetical protein